MYLGEAAKRYMKEGSQPISLDFGKLRKVLEDGQVEGTLKEIKEGETRVNSVLFLK